MEEGSFRCDANVSIMPKGATAFGTRTEIKNLNSFKHVEKALHYEIVRKKELLLAGSRIEQETRLWDPVKNRTSSMRSKEEAHDYRYFPDPDLLPLIIDEQWIDSAKESLPELPEEKKERFISQFGLSSYDAEVLTANREMAEFFETCLTQKADPKQACNWIMGPLLGLLNAAGKSITESPVTPADLARLIQLIEDGTISGKLAKTVFEEMAATGRTAAQIVSEKNLTQVTDAQTIETAVSSVLTQHPTEVARYRAGQKKLFGFFVGQVMKATQGKANPKQVNDCLRDQLDKPVSPKTQP
jgi:aspartyl-tRNA(Asn)/glutamyl-tRNA(Gln) amidotransferase subunit B